MQNFYTRIDRHQIDSLNANRSFQYGRKRKKITICAWRKYVTQGSDLRDYKRLGWPLREKRETNRSLTMGAKKAL